MDYDFGCPPVKTFILYPIDRTDDRQNRMTPQDIKDLSKARKVWLENLKP